METPRLSNTEQEMAIIVALVTGLRICGGRRDRQRVQVGGRTNGAAMGGGGNMATEHVRRLDGNWTEQVGGGRWTDKGRAEGEGWREGGKHRVKGMVGGKE